MPYTTRSTQTVAAAPPYAQRVVRWSHLEQRIGLSETRLVRSMAVLDKASVLLDQTVAQIDRLWQRPVA
jgi:hypothetical protein